MTWHPVSGGTAPASKTTGNPFAVSFTNRRSDTVELFWMNPKGNPQSYGIIESGKSKGQQARSGAVWKIVDAETNQELGHFRIGTQKAKAIIPAN